MDVILDVVGAPYLKKNIDALAMDGRLFIIGMQHGKIGEIDLGPIVVKRLTIAGTSFSSTSLMRNGVDVFIFDLAFFIELRVHFILLCDVHLYGTTKGYSGLLLILYTLFIYQHFE